MPFVQMIANPDSTRDPTYLHIHVLARLNGAASPFQISQLLSFSHTPCSQHILQSSILESSSAHGKLFH